MGWCLETIYAIAVLGHFVKRGFLFGPICPIYGFGAILLILTLKNVKGKNITKFLVAMIAFSIFEFIASWILEILFHQRWWDYSNAFLNIQGRVCLSFSIVWGIIGVLFINYLHPFVEKQTEKLLRKISFPLQRTMIYLLTIILIVDVVFSSVKNL